MVALNMTPIDERFSASLHYASRLWRQVLDRRLKDLGLGQAGWMTIAKVARASSPCSQSELAHQVGVEGATMVAMIDRLVRDGLVLRTPSPSDRRVRLIALTDQGRQLYARVQKEADACRKELLQGIDEQALLQATDILERVQQAAEARL